VFAERKGDHVQRAREEVYRSLDPADHADVKRAALMIYSDVHFMSLGSMHAENRRTYSRQNFDASVIDGNDERRPGGVFGLQVKARVVGGYEKTNDDDSSNIKKQNADVNTTYRLRQTLSGIFGFTSSNLSGKTPNESRVLEPVKTTYSDDFCTDE
jgi:hypothetical protein